MVGSGFRGGVAEASVIAECRMYTNSKELIAGYTKSQWRAFRNPLGAAIASALLILTSILPVAFGLAGSLLGWINYFALVATRLLVAIRTRSTVSNALLHPISAALWIYLIASRGCESLGANSRGAEDHYEPSPSHNVAEKGSRRRRWSRWPRYCCTFS